jgi:mono/diheme cytochrome c family protein
MKSLFLLLAACSGVVEQPDFERMIDQPSARPFEASSWFADGRAMRPPPAGVVAHGRVVGQPERTEGLSDKVYAARIPIALDRRVLDAGRARFDIYCAACHGLRGDGDSEVARNMELRKPPNLLAPPIRDYPPGRVFHAATAGYGLMPAYRAELSVDERWAVVAYLRALQLSQSVPLDQLPISLRQAVKEALP